MIRSNVDINFFLKRIWTFLGKSCSMLLQKNKKLFVEILGLSLGFFLFSFTTHSPLSHGAEPSCYHSDKSTQFCTPTVTSSDTSSNVNMGYGGLKWTLGESYVPEIVAGYRYASVTSSGATQGGDVSIAFKVTGEMNLENLIQLGKLRAKYLNGMDYLQGEVGGGWDFAKKGLFTGIGAQGPYVNSGVDYDFSNKDSFSKSFTPFVMFNSIGIYNTPHSTTESCQKFEDGGWGSGTLVNNKCKYTHASDRRLKRDIHHIATLKNGIKIYAFKYLKTDKVYVGVMAQDLLKNPLWKKAVIKQENGFYAVDYGVLGLRMTTFTEWKNKGAAVIQLEKYTAQYEKPRLEVLNFQYLNIHS
jgi:hypothetical protein